MIKKFKIDDAYLTSVTIRNEWSMYKNRENLSHEQLVKVLKGEDKITSITTDDHPKFKELRDQLEDSGYIITNRNCWNGDSVLKPFILNNLRFKKGDRFPCGSAMKIHINIMLKFAKKDI